MLQIDSSDLYDFEGMTSRIAKAGLQNGTREL